jgi:hypothetical protein
LVEYARQVKSQPTKNAQEESEAADRSRKEQAENHEVILQAFAGRIAGCFEGKPRAYLLDGDGYSGRAEDASNDKR